MLPQPNVFSWHLPVEKQGYPHLGLTVFANTNLACCSISNSPVNMAQPSHLNFKMETVSGESKDI